MKFMVKIQLNPATRESVMESFELRGPNRNPGVTFGGAWIDTHSDVVFVLVESDSELLVDQAIQAWNPPGDVDIHPVVDVEQY